MIEKRINLSCNDDLLPCLVGHIEGYMCSLLFTDATQPEHILTHRDKNFTQTKSFQRNPIHYMPK